MGYSVRTGEILVYLAFASVAAVVASMAVTLLYRRYLGTGAGISLLLAVLAGMLAVIAALAQGEWLGPFGHSVLRPASRGEFRPAVGLISAFALPFFAVPLLAKLYRKWWGGQLTDAERAAGAVGFRAWIGGGNLVFAVALALCAWLAYGYSFWAVLASIVAALAVYPAVRTLGAPADADLPIDAGLSPRPSAPDERERVLRLLEEGRITAEECAELLNALAHAEPATAARPVAPWARLQLAGAALVLIAFFLPWFSVDVGAEVQRMERALRVAPRGTVLQGDRFPIPLQGPPMTINAEVTVYAGDIGRGLGWAVLLLAVAAAVLPFVPTRLDDAARWWVQAALVAIGSVVLLYLITGSLRHVSVGPVVALIGYALLWAGAWRGRPASALTALRGQPVGQV